MSEAFTIAATVTAVSLVVLLLCDSKQRRVAAGVAKAICSSAFVAAALLTLSASSFAAGAALAAFVLCWAGDFFLIGRGKKLFLLGLGTFLLGHVAFVFAFAPRAALPVSVAAAMAMSVLSAFLLRWLLPHVSPKLAVPVRLYVAAIGAMVATAVGTRDPLIADGAVMFMLSDLFVARNRFVAEGTLNRAIGLPLYYGAVYLLLFALSPRRIM